MTTCDALSRQGSVCNRERGHLGCHEDTRTEGRWWGDIRDEPAVHPLEVVFTVEEGDVYIDPDDVPWYVHTIGPFDVVMQRIVTQSVNARDLVRKWRKLGEDEPELKEASPHDQY